MSDHELTRAAQSRPGCPFEMPGRVSAFALRSLPLAPRGSRRASFRAARVRSPRLQTGNWFPTWRKGPARSVFAVGWLNRGWRSERWQIVENNRLNPTWIPQPVTDRPWRYPPADRVLSVSGRRRRDPRPAAVKYHIRPRSQPRRQPTSRLNQKQPPVTWSGDHRSTHYGKGIVPGNRVSQIRWYLKGIERPSGCQQHGPGAVPPPLADQIEIVSRQPFPLVKSGMAAGDPASRTTTHEPMTLQPSTGDYVPSVPRVPDRRTSQAGFPRASPEASGD